MRSAVFESKLKRHEAVVADLIAVYEAVEAPYFAAVEASTPTVPRTVASDSSE